MKKISTYIIEKLRINKDTKIKIQDYYQCDIEDITDEITSKEIDDVLEKVKYKNSYFGAYSRKTQVKPIRNRFWYAIYCYLYDVGPQNVENIMANLKPDASGYGRFFSALRSHNIISSGKGSERGLQFPHPPSEWKI